MKNFFYRGLYSTYSANKELYSQGFFIATDTHQLIAGGVEVGINPEQMQDILDFMASKGQPNGLATLDENGKVPVSQINGELAKVVGLEKFLNTKAELDTLDPAPEVGDKYYVVEDKKIYTKTADGWDGGQIPHSDTIYNHRLPDAEGRVNILYRWDGATMVEISASLALGEVAGTAYEGNKGKANADAIVVLQEEMQEVQENKVSWDETKKVIQLPIDGSISAVQDSGTGSAGVLVCQRNYGEGNVTEIGNARNKLTLNATERPQIDLAGGGKEKIAYESDLIKYGMYYPGVKVDTKKLFALTKASTEDEIKAALQLKTASGGYTLPTEDILNDCLGKGYQLLSNWMPVSVTWNGAAWVFYIVGQTYMNEPNAVATVSIKITDGVYSVFQAAKVTELADMDDLRLMPNVIQFPLRTLQDKVYTQEEILEWFGVTEISELKQKIVREGIQYLQYGISLSGNPMYYKMPVEYVAFESANQIKLVFTGLDTHNDTPAKYEILINLDGAIIEGNSNVKLTITPLTPSSVDIDNQIKSYITQELGQETMKVISQKVVSDYINQQTEAINSNTEAITDLKQQVGDTPVIDQIQQAINDLKDGVSTEYDTLKKIEDMCKKGDSDTLTSANQYTDNALAWIDVQ